MLARGGDPDPYHGHKLRYVNPATGEAAMPTIGTFIQLLPRGFAGLPYRSTDAAVYVCVEGRGETRVSLPAGGEKASGESMGGQMVLRWAPRDIFVVPGWMSHTHHAADDSVLFSFSDRPVQEKLDCGERCAVTHHKQFKGGLYDGGIPAQATVRQTMQRVAPGSPPWRG